MSFSQTRRRFVVISLAFAAAGSIVAIGCGGDDVDTQTDTDASADGGLVIDGSIIINVDSGKKDSGAGVTDASDASDDAALCPDGAPGTMCPADAGIDAD